MTAAAWTPRRSADWDWPDTAEQPEDLVGQVTPDEGRKLRELAAAVPANQVIVELGSYTGKSTACLAVGSAEGVGVPVYAVDLWDEGTSQKGGSFRKYDPRMGETRGSAKFHHPDAFAKFCRRINQYDPGGLVVPCKQETAEAGQALSQQIQKPVGLLFIDAEHTYDAVRRDFRAWLPHVALDGVICFHDYAEKSPGDDGVTSFVDHLQAVDQPWRITEIVYSMAVLRRLRD